MFKVLFNKTAIACLVFLVSFSGIAENIVAPQNILIARASSSKKPLTDRSAQHKGKARGDISKFTLSVEQAQELDKLTRTHYDNALPLAPLLYPRLATIHDKNIAKKINDLERDARIQLPDGKIIPYWQTLQYANRHFRVYISRFWEQNTKKKVFHPISQVERVRLWAVLAYSRKVLIHPEFKRWVYSRKFGPRRKIGGPRLTPKQVYAHYQKAYQASYIRTGRLKGGGKIAVANGKGITFGSGKNFLQKPFHNLSGTLMHEVAHNLGYSHRSRVPYPIGYAFKRFMKKNDFWRYRVYDLANTPDFVVLSQSP